MRDKHIRLRVQTCGNGDECPALDRREAGWIEVTGELVDRPGLPPLPNTAAGQDIRVLDVAEVPAVAVLLRVGDLAVVEGQYVAQLRYGPSGEYHAAVATGADAAVGYVALAQLVWELGTPFTTWWAAHPQYHRDNAAA